MSRHRHKARGGGTKPVWEAGGETNAAKEAEDKEEGSRGLKHGGHKRKHGGHVEGEGEALKHGAHKRARGGKVGHHHAVAHEGHSPGHHAHGGHVSGPRHHHSEHAEEKHHHDVKHHSMAHKEHAHGSHIPGRKRGGGIGANRMPLSTAANIKEVVPGERGEDQDKD